MDRKQAAVYIITIILSAIFIFCGYKYNTREYSFLSGEQADSAYSGRITRIISDERVEDDIIKGRVITFECLIGDKDMKGSTVTAVQNLDDLDQMPQPPVEEGDKVLQIRGR